MAYVRKFVKKEAVVIKVNVADAVADNLHARIMKQIAAILDALETEANITWAQRLQAVNVMGRLVFADEREQKLSVPADTGSSVRKYSEAFKGETARAGRRANPTGPRPATGFDLDPIEDEIA